MNRQKFTYYFAIVIFTILLVLVGDMYFHFNEENESVNIEQFNKMLLNAIGFSIFINALIHITNYYIQKSKTGVTTIL